MDKISGDLNDKFDETVCRASIDSTSTTSDHPKVVNYYSSVDYPTSDSNKYNEEIPYMNPVSTIVKHHSVMSNNDYEAPPVYETPRFEISDMLCRQYEIAVTSTIKGSIRDNLEGSMVSEGLSDEQIYEDPGHKEEEIYLWFEEKKFRKIKGSNIKCVGE